MHYCTLSGSETGFWNLSTAIPTYRLWRLVLLSRATYAMERVLSLPPNLTRILRNAYFPQAYISPGPKICRLYLGKSYPSTPGRFFNSENFPLDVARYTHLRDSSDVEFPELSEVAEGIGEMLGRFHFIGGYNARDVEFVLGGNVYTGFSFYLIDFNQVSFIYIYISVWETPCSYFMHTYLQMKP